MLKVVATTFFLMLFSSHVYISAEAGSGGLGRDTIYETMSAGLRDLHVDVSKSAVVSNCIIKRDVATFTLRSGTLTFCEPVAGRVCAAVFIGDGQLDMTPPTTVEKEQLARKMKVSSISQKFGQLFLLFTDTTYTSLSQQLRWTTLSDHRPSNNVIDNSKPFYSDSKSEWVISSIVTALLEGITTDAFFSQCSETGARDLFFRIQPDDAEEVQFARRAYSSRALQDVAETVCQFHLQDDYHRGINPCERASVVDVLHYTIDFTIDERLHSTGIATMKLHPRFGRRRWILMELAPNLVVAGIFADTTRLTWKNVDGLYYIHLEEPTVAFKDFEIRMIYGGNMFLRQVDYIYMQFGSSSWYPRTGELGRSTFDMTFHTSTAYKFQSAGSLESESINGDMQTSHYLIKRPQIHTSFAIGIFKESRIEDKRIPPVKVWYERDAEQQENVCQDILLSMIYYQELFGKPQFERMTAAEINAYHGQAFPGFLHLSFVTFVNGDGSGNEEQFVAHEVAHQWWGGGLAWCNYHDQWMSEAFAEYSSMMYMQSVLKNNKNFFRMLDRYKKLLVENRKSFLGNGEEAGPIWLGHRVASSDRAAGDYTKIIYYKGAWIMHMLRNMMMDLNTFSDAKYITMMRDYYQTYQGMDPSTEDFLKMVSKHMGQDMTWFFDEWVYGSKMPKYTVSYKSVEQADGKFKVTMRVTQENVPSTFRMIVPITLNFGDNGTASVQTVISGATSEFDLPLLPYKPESIDFNVYSSVLCEWEMKKWE